MHEWKKGFTLFEIVVGMSVTLAIAVVAYSFTEDIVRLWNASDQNMAIESEVNAALDEIVKDLESAIFRENRGVMFAVEVLEDKDNSGNWDTAPRLKPTAGANDPSEDRYGFAGHWLRLICAAPTVNAVSYQIVRRKWYSDLTKAQYRLYRSVVSQVSTLEAGYDLSDLNSDYYLGTANEGEPGVVLKTRQDEVLLNHVIDFGVRLYVYDDTGDGTADAPVGMRLIFPSNGSDNLDDADMDHYATTGFGTDDGFLYPEAVEVVVRVLSQDGADLLYEWEEDGGSDEGWLEIVEEHDRVYRRFAEVRTSSL